MLCFLGLTWGTTSNMSHDVDRSNVRDKHVHSVSQTVGVTASLSANGSRILLYKGPRAADRIEYTTSTV